jgi:hypothetical protein
MQVLVNSLLKCTPMLTATMLRSSVRRITSRTVLNYKPSRGIITLKEAQVSLEKLNLELMTRG